MHHKLNFSFTSLVRKDKIIHFPSQSFPMLPCHQWASVSGDNLKNRLGPISPRFECWPCHVIVPWPQIGQFLSACLLSDTSMSSCKVIGQIKCDYEKHAMAPCLHTVLPLSLIICQTQQLFLFKLPSKFQIDPLPSFSRPWKQPHFWSLAWMTTSSRDSRLHPLVLYLKCPYLS